MKQTWNIKKWIKRKKAIKKGLIIPGPAFKDKLPGSQRQRHYAREVLHCEQIESGIWKVWGGRNEHLVKMGGSIISCDCPRFQIEHKICSHLIKIGLEQGHK